MNYYRITVTDRQMVDTWKVEPDHRDAVAVPDEVMKRYKAAEEAWEAVQEEVFLFVAPPVSRRSDV